LRESEIAAVEAVVTELDSGNYIAYLTWTFPIQVLTNYIFCYLTERKFTFRAAYILDIATAAVVIVWCKNYY